MDQKRYYFVAYQLKRTYHALTTALDAAVFPLGISLAQANALLFVDRFPDTTLPRLAQAAAVTPQALHRTLVALERQGLVRRAHIVGNEKTFLWSLTDNGKHILDKAEERIKNAQDKTAEHLTVQELTALQELLEKYELIFKGGGDDKKE
jgi:DNA-binding MarR family transcriptional regulator